MGINAAWLLLATLWPAAALPTADPVPGGIVVVPVPGDGRPEAYLGGERVLVTGQPGRWQAVVGIGLDAKPGPGTLQVRTPESTRTLSFRILAREYAVQHVTIPDQRKVDPLPADLVRIDMETALMNGVRAHWTDLDVPALALGLPVQGSVSGNFGLRRVFNGAARQPHGGMDIVAPRGTPVAAPAAGAVVLVGDYFFNGNTVFIDHGQRLLTMYCHLDQVRVQAGEGVAAGDIIGTVGQTGRASGPHLHWSVYLNGVAVNPALLVEKPISR
jgi:murein DD-endopeptidase MepM/ murein hydrolase activator NlpD